MARSGREAALYEVEYERALRNANVYRLYLFILSVVLASGILVMVA